MRVAENTLKFKQRVEGYKGELMVGRKIGKVMNRMKVLDIDLRVAENIREFKKRVWEVMKVN